MRGHVRKRGKRWYIVYDEGRNEHGKRKQRWRGGYVTRKEAEDALTGVMGAMQRQEYAPPEKLTYATFVRERWLPAAAMKRRPSTMEAYHRYLNKHILPAIGGIQLQKLDASRLDRLYLDLLQGEEPKGDKPGRRPLAPGTVRFVAAIISSSLRYAKRKRLVVRNVAADADIPSVSRPKLTVWSDRELRAFLNHVRDNRLYALWRLLAVSGARRGEALALTWLNVDFDSGKVKIDRQLVPVGRELVFGDPKTEAGVRSIPLDDGTIEALREHRERQNLERMMLGHAYLDQDLVFCEPDGKPLDPRGVSQFFQRLRGKAGLPHIRLHDLRHGMATMALADQVNAELVRRRLGHSRISTTVDLYQRHDAEEVERAVGHGIGARLDS